MSDIQDAIFYHNGVEHSRMKVDFSPEGQRNTASRLTEQIDYLTQTVGPRITWMPEFLVRSDRNNEEK